MGKLEKENKLYFLAMGMDFTPERDTDMKESDVLNYRIRTTFHDKDNNIIFIEVSRGYERDSKGRNTNTIKLHINHLYNRTLSENENDSYIRPNDKYIKNYTKEDILYFINKSFGTNFEELIVVSHLSQFDYNKTTGDNFRLDVKKLTKVLEIDKYFYKYEKEVLKKQYPNHSIYWKNGKLEILMHYNGYNDIIKIDDVFNYKFNYKKPNKEV